MPAAALPTTASHDDQRRHDFGNAELREVPDHRAQGEREHERERNRQEDLLAEVERADQQDDEGADQRHAHRKGQAHQYKAAAPPVASRRGPSAGTTAAPGSGCAFVKPAGPIGTFMFPGRFALRPLTPLRAQAFRRGALPILAQVRRGAAARSNVGSIGTSRGKGWARPGPIASTLQARRRNGCFQCFGQKKGLPYGRPLQKKLRIERSDRLQPLQRRPKCMLRSPRS